MKTAFEKVTNDELIARISSLDESSKTQWGKMNVGQMLKHCTLWEEMTVSPTNAKRAFIIFMFGKMALKNLTKDDRPLARNTPTLPILVIKGPVDFDAEKKKWIRLLRTHEHFVNDNYIHPFFGKMTREEIGILAYKHTDHHLRQFGV
jgi:hypothetical protein